MAQILSVAIFMMTLPKSGTFLWAMLKRLPRSV